MFWHKMHPTAANIATRWQSAPYPTLLVGPRGSGRTYHCYEAIVEHNGSPNAAARIRQRLARDIYQIEFNTPIAQAREILTELIQNQATELKNRYLVVSDLDLASAAHNDLLLKLLEEPLTNTKLIVTAQHTSWVRPAILSRTAILHHPAPTREDIAHLTTYVPQLRPYAISTTAKVPIYTTHHLQIAHVTQLERLFDSITLGEVLPQHVKETAERLLSKPIPGILENEIVDYVITSLHHLLSIQQNPIHVGFGGLIHDDYSKFTQYQVHGRSTNLKNTLALSLAQIILTLQLGGAK